MEIKEKDLNLKDLVNELERKSDLQAALITLSYNASTDKSTLDLVQTTNLHISEICEAIKNIF